MFRTIQTGDDDPTQAPAREKREFQKPDPRSLVDKKSIKVPAGTFKALHYREETGSTTVDTWVSQEVAPVGLIKRVIATTSQLPGDNKPMTTTVVMELVRTGTGAKPIITKPAKPL